jgi:hypothetical protein
MLESGGQRPPGEHQSAGAGLPEEPAQILGTAGTISGSGGRWDAASKASGGGDPSGNTAS